MPTGAGLCPQSHQNKGPMSASDRNGETRQVVCETVGRGNVRGGMRAYHTIIIVTRPLGPSTRIMLRLAIAIPSARFSLVRRRPLRVRVSVGLCSAPGWLPAHREQGRVVPPAAPVGCQRHCRADAGRWLCHEPLGGGRVLHLLCSSWWAAAAWSAGLLPPPDHAGRRGTLPVHHRQLRRFRRWRRLLSWPCSRLRHKPPAGQGSAR